MFNNPFESFHDRVVEAKREREQLDRLLMISTPRERLLVAAIALFLSVLLAWLLFGNVARSLALDGVLVAPQENPSPVNRSVRALVWIDSNVAPRIKTGMPAMIELAAIDGEGGTLDGQVASISAVPLREGIAAPGAAPPVSLHRLDIALEDGADAGAVAGRECRVVIELGRQSPVSLFGMRRP